MAWVLPARKNNHFRIGKRRLQPVLVLGTGHFLGQLISRPKSGWEAGFALFFELQHGSPKSQTHSQKYVAADILFKRETISTSFSTKFMPKSFNTEVKKWCGLNNK